MVIFFYGTETFQPFHKISELKQKYLTKNPSGSGLVVFDCSDDCSVTDIVSQLGAQNLFTDKKLVIVKNFFAATKAPEQKVLQEKLAEGSDDVIVVWEQSQPRKNAALYKWLLKNADQKQEAAERTGAQLSAWIAKHLNTIDPDAKIARDAVDKLILFCGSDLWRLHGELRKLSDFADGREITAEDVEQLTHAQVDAEIFATIDALARRDKKQALTLLKKQIAKGDDPFYVFSMYVYQLRTLLAIGGFVWNGETDRYAIAKQAKLHPFVVQKSLSALNQFSETQLKDAYAMLQTFDADVKTGKRDIDAALDLFVVKL